MDFLGHVNVFHGRVEQGRPCGGAGGGRPGDAPRPCDRGQRLRAAARTGNRATPERHSEPGRQRGTHQPGRVGGQDRPHVGGRTEIKVELPFDQYQQLDLHLGEQVFVAPKKVRVFVPDPEYSI